MTYKIIGGDGQQYGPAEVAQLREWIAAGRANAQTLAQAEGSLEWKPLGSYGDFADLASAPAPVTPPYLGSTDQRKSKGGADSPVANCGCASSQPADGLALLLLALFVLRSLRR
jgi:MYXO-CTERM domain-containing protein